MNKRGNSKRKSELEILEERYRKIYKTWDRTFCPALNAEVEFTNTGWDHLYVRKKRSKVQLMERYIFLPHAKKVIESNLTKVRGNGYKDGYHMYNIEGEIGGVKIVVDLTKNKNGFMFFSHHKEEA